MSEANPLAAPRDLDELHERASRPNRPVRELVAKTNSDIAVLGAGGKMGFHLCRMLQRALLETGSSYQVIAVSRFGTPDSTDPFDAHDIPTRSLDLTEQTAIQKLPDVQDVFFLAGIKFGTTDHPDQLRRMNIEMPQRVADQYSNSNARIVALSTGCVYPFVTPASKGSVETDPLDPPGEYARSCVGREEAFADSGATCSLIRLNYSVDLRYGVLVDIAQQVWNGQPVDVTTGYVNVIWQGDAIAHIILALQHASSPPFVVNVTGPRILAVRDIAKRFGELFDKPVELTGTEQATAWLNNASRSHQLWGPPEISEDQLIQWVADWIRRGQPTLDKPTQFQVRDGKY